MTNQEKIQAYNKLGASFFSKMSDDELSNYHSEEDIEKIKIQSIDACLAMNERGVKVYKAIQEGDTLEGKGSPYNGFYGRLGICCFVLAVWFNVIGVRYEAQQQHEEITKTQEIIINKLDSLQHGD